MRVDLELRNLPRARILEYLYEAGGSPSGEDAVSADGWSARLEEMEPAQVGAFMIPRDLLILEGDELPVARMKDFMERKTMRGGG